ncbi:hypothetical protein GCM10023176_00080 [Micromonospora coerulea]|uniref:Uncharacterized protein n=1 Tax=Micromonospora coerulea TaxID=47856 RepID=A0ABP8S485_9ACTN
MNFDPIIVAMVSAIQMLDHASPDEVDPDFAVQVQQIMGDYLSELSPKDVPEFRRIVSRIADERSSGDPVIADYLRRLADGLASQE